MARCFWSLLTVASAVRSDIRIHPLYNAAVDGTADRVVDLFDKNWFSEEDTGAANDADMPESATVDVTNLIRKADHAGTVRCCCDAARRKLGLWRFVLDGGSIGRTGKCSVHVDARGLRCGQLRSPPWATGWMHHYETTQGECKVASEEVVHILQAVGTPSNYCKGIEGAFPPSSMGTGVAVTCPSGFDGGTVLCSYLSASEGLYKPTPTCTPVGAKIGRGRSNQNLSAIPSEEPSNHAEEEQPVQPDEADGPLSNAEYEEFLEVGDLEANLNRVVELGKRIASHLHSEDWRKQLGSAYRLTRFLHRSTSALPKKMAEAVYASKPLHGALIAVVGAGPSGLRFAIEATLLGARVHVFEKRSKFDRYNVLKLWAFSMEDLKSIGVQDLYPYIATYRVKRLPIAVLQHSLARIALSLGVGLHVECDVTGWTTSSDGSPSLNVNPACAARSALAALPFDAIFDGSGTRSVLRDGGLGDEESMIHSHIRKGAAALGMTMNFKRFKHEQSFYQKTEHDPRFAKHNPAIDDTSNLAYQFAKDLFDSKSVALRNWVYWQGQKSHYVVLTITSAALVSFGVVSPSDAKLPVQEFLRRIDRSKLPQLGLQIAEEWNFPHESNNASAYIEQRAGAPDISIFEFGKTTEAKQIVKFLTVGSSSVLFGLLGDSIITPFWPFGTGANHAIYSAHLQAMTMVAWWSDWKSQSVIALADEMKKRMLAIPLSGNALGFSKKDYELQVSRNYQHIENNEVPNFY